MRSILIPLLFLAFLPLSYACKEKITRENTPAPTPQEVLEADKMILSGYYLYKQKKYAEALAVFVKTREKFPGFAKAYYNEACVLALLGRKDEALKALEISVSLDGQNSILAQQDSDFASIKNEAAFQQAIKVDDSFESFLGKNLSCGRCCGVLSYKFTLQSGGTLQGGADAGGATYRTECVGGSWKIHKNVLSVTLNCEYTQVGAFGVPGVSPPWPPSQIITFSSPDELRRFFSNKNCEFDYTYTL